MNVIADELTDRDSFQVLVLHDGRPLESDIKLKLLFVATFGCIGNGGVRIQTKLYRQRAYLISHILKAAVSRSIVRKLQLNVFSNALEIPVIPVFTRILKCGIALFPTVPKQIAARFQLRLVRWTENYIDLSAIRLPSCRVPIKMSVAKGDAAVMFNLKFIVERIGIWRTSRPELLNELIPLLIGPQVQECTALV